MSSPVYEISTDPARLDRVAACDFINTESYWGRNRTREQTLTSIEHSFCVGAYADDKQVGFARAVSDHVFFGYIFDVFVLPEHRGQGLAHRLVQGLFEHPDLKDVRTWMLASRHAQGLYETMGFRLVDPGIYMRLDRVTG